MADLMTTAEVAELLRRPKETLRYWRWRGEGPRSFKVGRSIMYDRTDVDTWLAAQKRITGSGGEVGGGAGPASRMVSSSGAPPRHHAPRYPDRPAASTPQHA